jgi:hypothetical protein
VLVELPLEVELLVDALVLLEVDELVETSPLEDALVEVLVPPPKLDEEEVVETLPLDVLVDEPPVEVEVEPPLVEVELPPVEVELPPVLVEPPLVEVELPPLPPVDVLVEAVKMALPLDPPKKPPLKKPPPKPPPKPPLPPITVTPPPELPAIGGSGGSGIAMPPPG